MQQAPFHHFITLTYFMIISKHALSKHCIGKLLNSLLRAGAYPFPACARHVLGLFYQLYSSGLLLRHRSGFYPGQIWEKTLACGAFPPFVTGGCDNVIFVRTQHQKRSDHFFSAQPKTFSLQFCQVIWFYRSFSCWYRWHSRAFRNCSPYFSLRLTSPWKPTSATSWAQSQVLYFFTVYLLLVSRRLSGLLYLVLCIYIL